MGVFGQVPVTAASLILVWFTVKIPVRPSEADSRSNWLRIDYMGAITLVLALVLLLLGLSLGGNTVPWTHPLVLTTLPLAAVVLAVIVYVDMRCIF